MLYSDSMPTPLPYLHTILETARESGRSEREISRSATGQPAAISLIKTGRVPSVERVRRLCDALDLEFYIGPRRRRFPSKPWEEARQVREARAPRIEYVGETPIEGLGRPKPRSHEDRVLVGGRYSSGMQDRQIASPRLWHKEPAPLDEPAPLYLEIREVGIQGAETCMAFRHDWLVQHGINPVQSIILGVSGESMEPTVPDGASVLVDRSRQEFRSGSVFVVRTGGALLVKRADQDAAGRWLLVSDHVGWLDEP